MSIWILNGQVWNESTGKVEEKHVQIENGVISAIVSAEGSVPDTAGHDVVNAKGKLISAGFIDMHVHLREPGFEYKEDYRKRYAIGCPRRIYYNRLYA